MYKQFNLEKLSYYSLFLAVFFLPIKTSISNLGIIILLSLTFASFFINRKKVRGLKKPLFFLNSTICLFIPFLMGTFYSQILDDAFFQLNKCIFYLLMPMLLLRKDLSKDKIIYWSSIGLILGSIFSILFLLSVNSYHFFSSNLALHKLLSYDFVGLNFVKPLKDMHPIYLGSYYLFMLVLLWKSKLNLKMGIKIGITIVCLIGIIFLNTRSVLFIGILLLIIALFSSLTIKKTLAILSLIFLFLFFAKPLLKDTYVYNKMVKGTKWELSNNIGKNNTDSKKTADSRMSRWLVSIDLIKQKPLIGYGTGSARDLLSREYEKRNMKSSLNANYDSHNQYLGYAIQFGILGLSFLLFYLSINLYKSFKRKDFILFSLVLIVGGICLIENYLIRNMGINFLALFGTIFIFKNNKDD